MAFATTPTALLPFLSPGKQPVWACLSPVISNQTSHHCNPQTLQGRQAPSSPNIPIPLLLWALWPWFLLAIAPFHQALPKGPLELSFHCKQMPPPSQSFPRRLSSFPCSLDWKMPPLIKEPSPSPPPVLGRENRFFFAIGSRLEHDSSAVKADPSMSFKQSS